MKTSDPEGSLRILPTTSTERRIVVTSLDVGGWGRSGKTTRKHHNLRQKTLHYIRSIWKSDISTCNITTSMGGGPEKRISHGISKREKKTRTEKPNRTVSIE